LHPVVKYDIENLGVDHPALLTGNFQACAVARCREVSASPYSLDIDCHNLSASQTSSEICDLAWQNTSEAIADKAENTYQPRRLTEDAAIGLCAVAFAILHEGEITEVTTQETGVDYWVDDRRAVVEISGIEKGNVGSLVKRHSEKEKQLRSGSSYQAGFPGYVFVVDFGQKKSTLSHHR
jgi:hypothetical protein